VPPTPTQTSGGILVCQRSSHCALEDGVPHFGDFGAPGRRASWLRRTGKLSARCASKRAYREQRQTLHRPRAADTSPRQGHCFAPRESRQCVTPAPVGRPFSPDVRGREQRHGGESWDARVTGDQGERKRSALAERGHYGAITVLKHCDHSGPIDECSNLMAVVYNDVVRLPLPAGNHRAEALAEPTPLLLRSLPAETLTV
jgi:hypothetical protein